MKKYIIGLGCSWTQGEGGYPEEIWKQYNGSPQRALRGKDDYAIRHYEHENSWVNVLCRDYFPDYEPVNLGVKGIGNRAAVGQLHFCDKVDFNNSTGIIVLMMSGFERLDLFQRDPIPSNGQDDMYSKNEYRHYKWRTAWPVPGQKAGDAAYYDVYGRELWSEQFVAAHQMCNLLDLQNFAKAYGFKLVVANAFNWRKPMTIKQYLRDNAGYLVDKFDWSTYVHDYKPYSAFVQKLAELDNIMGDLDWTSFHQYYSQRDWPAKYLTNCEGAHPTIDGYKVIGSELAEFIKSRGYV